MNLLFNLRYTLRLLRKSPGTAVVAVFIMALGLAVAVPLYALIKNIGYSSLPFPDGDRIVRVMALNNETGQPLRIGFDSYQYELMKSSLENVEEFAAYDSFRVILSDGDVAVDFMGGQVTSSFFSIMPAEPFLGRTLQPADEEPGAPAVVVLGYNTWQNYYSGNPDIIGQSSRINGEPHTVVGVMPEGYRYPEVRELWTALPLKNSNPGGVRNLSVMATLSESTDLSETSVAIGTLFDGLRADYPDIYPLVSATVVPFTRYLAVSTDMSTIGILMSGIALATLVLVSFNLGNLLLIRANERLQELSIRNALGSTKLEIIREVLRESLIICTAGLAFGLILSRLVLDFFNFEINYLLGTEGSFMLPPWAVFELTPNVVLISFLTTFFIWIATGLFSAWRLARRDIGTFIQGGAHSLIGGAGKRALHVLVGLEITVSAALLVVCGASFIATINGTRADFGAVKDNFFTGYVVLSASAYDSKAARLNYLNELHTELLDQNDFTDVTFSTAVPGQDGETITYALNDRQFDTDTPPSQNQVWVADNFFELFEVPLQEGRWFDAGDVDGSQPVVIVDELFAENTWPGESAIGKSIQVTQEQRTESLQIVGVTSHIIHDEPMAPQSSYTSLYRPIAQSPLDYFRVAVKVEQTLNADIAAVSSSLRQAATRVDRDVPVLTIHPLERVMQSSMNGNDTLGEILLGVAFVVFSLAIVALFAIVSRSIIARTTEVGIRRALGSTELKAISLFLKQGLGHVAFALPVGGGLGILISSSFLADTANVGSIIVNVSVVVALTITTMVFLASYIPSRKVVTMEPGEALHYE